MVMAETRRISDLMTRVIEGDPWHAGNVMDLLADLTVAEAKAKPVRGGHSIWQIVLHLTGWANEVSARVEGKAAGTPVKGDWPAVGAATAAGWSSAKEGLARAYQQLGTGLSRYLTIHGAIHHGVYHAGQIALLKRALRS
jgi:uncharacterized damage-inducible protein DinB